MLSVKAIHRYQRLSTWDYSKGAALFITIALENRKPLLGVIEKGRVVLSPLGIVVKESLEAIPQYNPGIRVFAHVVMPDHVHFNVHIEAGLQGPLKVLGKAIARFKNYTTKWAKCNLALVTSQSSDGAMGNSPGCAESQAVLGNRHPLWQQGYHDRICPTRELIDATARYIAYNPKKWELMHGSNHRLRIIEPLDSPRLSTADYWKGVGNVALLAADVPIVSLRVSRAIRTPHSLDTLIKRMRKAVRQGFVILSGFISPGEKAVRDMLCQNPAARFIRILPSCIPNARFKPESNYINAFETNRYLEIACGNNEVSFSRTTCLNYNDEIVKIAQSGPGYALYWKHDVVHKL